MSDGNKVQIEFGGGVDSSYQSSVDVVKKGQDEIRESNRKMVAEIVTSVAGVAGAYAQHHAKIGALRAAWEVASVAASRAAAVVVSAAPRVLGGLTLITGGVTVLQGVMGLLRMASDEVGVGLDRLAAKEDLVSKLKPLTGGLEAAKDKLKELAQVARGTKLELPEVVDTYRSTQVQTGGALSDKKGLTMIGDVSAATGNGLKDTGDAIGKLYGDLQAGAPIYEATQKLNDMGIVSAEVAKHLYVLQSEGKTGAEVWAYLAGELGKSSGAMKAAADNLSTLQKALLDAKNQLHELFAEASANGTGAGEDEGLKGQIRGQIDTLEALQPAAKEAGSVYASLRSIFSDTVTFVVSLTKSTDDQTKATDRSSDSILRHVGSLQKWVDVLTVAGVLVSALAATAVGYGAAISVGTLATAAGAIAVAGLTLAAAPAILAIGALGAVVLSAGVAYRIHADHAIEADKALSSLIQSNRSMLTSLHAQEEGIKSVTDKILFLAKAYGDLQAVQERLSKTKDPRTREELENTRKRISNDIRRAENRDDDKLKPGEARKKSQKDTKDAQDDTGGLLSDPDDKYNAALSDMEEARKYQFELRQKLDAAKKAAAPGGEASDKVINRQIRDANRRIEASKKRLKHDGSEDGYDPDVVAERQSQAEDNQKIRDLEGLRGGREQRIQNAHTELDAQDTVVAQSGTELVKAQKANEEYQAKLRQLDIEKQIASLDVEGLARAQEEWRLKREGLEADLKVAQEGPDRGKEGEIEVKIAQGDRALKKQEEEAGLRARGLQDERAIAELKTEGLERAREEWAIRRAGLADALTHAHGDTGKEDEINTKIVQGDAVLKKQEEAVDQRKREIDDERAILGLKTQGTQRASEEWAVRLKGLQDELALAESKHDDVKAGEITGKIVEGNNKLVKSVDADAVSSREIEAESKIASLQSEGIQRAREESEIRLGLVEARWREADAAKDTVAAEKERLNYIREQAAQAAKERENALVLGHDLRALDEARAGQQDNGAKRQIEREFKAGNIDDEERRKREAAIIRRARQRTLQDADQKDKEADDAKGDPDKEARLRREAVDLRTRADAQRAEHFDLLNPQNTRQNPIVSDLQKIGGGGAAYLGGGQRTLEGKTDELIRQQKETNTLLKGQARRDNRQRVL